MFYCIVPKKCVERLWLFCALGLVRSLVCSVLCARLVRTSCADSQMFASLKHLVLGVVRMLCASCAWCSAEIVGLGHFFGWSCALLCWGLGRKIPPPWAPNTLYLDKVLCVSCAPGAFAKKSLGQPCAEIFSVEIFIGFRPAETSQNQMGILVLGMWLIFSHNTFLW